YHQVVWSVESMDDSNEPSITFTHTSPDGDENYPGTLKMHVTYSLSSDNALTLKYDAISDKVTPFNPTNHSFFNLSGDHSKKILDTIVQINASAVTLVDDELIPTGEITPVKDTPLDFTSGKALGVDIFAEDHLIQLNGGFDHNFCVDGTGLRLHAVVTHPDTGRIMEVYSDMPGLQLYTFNKGNHATGKNGVIMSDHTALCLESQFYPDSVNHKNFPFAYLQPNVAFASTTVYKFK
ncbi:MAG: aldose epimerase family protein, partial [Oscillospiraceae bacterium]